MKVETISDRSTVGTGLVGYITTTRRILEQKFGAPDEEGTLDNKVTTEWRLRFEDGTIATIYDWKRYEDDLEAPEMDEIYQWHIGGLDIHAVYAINNAKINGVLQPPR